MTTQRALSPFETGYFSASARFGSVPVAGMPLFVGSVVHGTVDADLLRRTLAELADVHPLLRCRVVTEGRDGGKTGSEGALEFRLQDDFRPELDVTDVTDGGDAAYLRLINTRQDWTEGLFRGRLLRDGSSSRVVLVVHHGIADGRSAFALLDEMWRRYTALASGTGLSVPVGRRLPDAVDTRLASVVSDAEADEFLDLVARGTAEGGPVPATLPPDGDGATDAPRDRFALDRVELDTATTEALVATARAHDLTVNALLCGAVLATVRAHLEPAAGALPMLCGHAADLRSSLRPELSASTVLNCASGLGTMLAVDAGADPVALAREVSADVRAALARRDPGRFMLASQRVRGEAEAAALGVRPTIAVSNVGRIPRHPVPEGLTVVRDEGYAMAVGMPPKLTVFTYDGKLTAQVEYDTAVHGRERMGRLGRDLETTLRKVALTPAGPGVTTV
ncbi:phthiocerol/phthiodiolone dimycocerosyl transferase family protein [Streptomyces albireticuli]|uniref:Phthiocerol/phthiodiolone dimycocerosyl transferase n=1 Tax=Streptomyces albireticuli TaxID=1940 RepID=A0A2A2CXX4_9ACTN|nr:hypothetical protein [Streptomyces albireticuli]MCD9145060.1 hypothetical protein [Streptomyces albireticuli]MCD9164486.1 hypothetical protein [Streptomyces albireticuli]MCD9194197.1 hypothetical protein [Streptomyces albireticuli]PAU44121.1 hypothetical protein CK936_36550 [Streptomyces albireticuli]